MELKKLLKEKNLKVEIKDEGIRRILSELDLGKGEGEIVYITDSASTAKDKDKQVYVYKLSLGNLYRFLKNFDRSFLYKGIVFELSEKLVGSRLERAYAALFFLILYLILAIEIFSIIPPDDLLRHLVSYKIGYDYSKIFVHTDLPKWNVHFSYEWLVGHIHSIISSIQDRLIQISVTVLIIDYLIITIFALGIRLILKDRGPLVYIITFSLIFSLIAGRLLLGRPTTLVLSLFILTIGLNETGRKILSVITASILSVMYYLFFIYMIPLAVYLRKRIIIPVIVGLIFWGVYAYIKGGNYILDIYKYIFSIDFDKIPISENASILSVLSTPVFVLILFLLFINWNKVRKKHFYASLFFYLSNQIRYVEVIVPLTVISIINIVEDFYRKVLKGKRLYAFILSISMILGGLKLNGEPPIFDEYVCKMIENKKLFTMPGDNFRIIYNCAGYNIKLSPSMEPRWSDKVYMEVYKDLKDKEISCDNRYLHEYDYLYEKMLKGKYDCLKLEYVDGKYRLWKIK